MPRNNMITSTLCSIVEDTSTLFKLKVMVKLISKSHQ